MKNQQIALVTGGNRGIGREICRQLNAEGFKVILTARDEKKGNSVTGELGESVSFFQLDVIDPDSIKRLAKFLTEKYGKLDVLINNAGILIGNQKAVEPDFGEVRQIMETNFYGPWQLTTALLPLLKKSGQGKVVNMSSGMGGLKEMDGGYAGYRMSKSSLNALTILLSNELNSDKISVNAMCPGWVRTDMGGKEAHRSVEQGADTAVWLAKQQEYLPTGQFFRDREVIEW
ncbi:MAG: SDR family oxidoreductase [FCB group bacterium]|nr:SDR family oxidoreductase [FCB group bacterium]